MLAVAGGLYVSRGAPRTDRTRAAMLLWGGWLIVSGIVFSFGSGTIHTYYTVALVPAIAAPVAIAATALWRERHIAGARLALALGVLVTATWSWVLLDRTPDWLPWLRVVIPVTAVLAIVGLLAASRLPGLGRRVSVAAATLGVIACLAAPIAYSGQTVSTAHTGSIPSAGPSTGTTGGGMATVHATTGTAHGRTSIGTGHGGGATNGGAGQGTTTTSTALTTALNTGAAHYRWVAAVSGSQSAATLELATGGDPVMAIGGFDNEGGNLTLAQFKQYVSRGDIHYYIASSTAAGGGTATGTHPATVRVKSTTGHSHARPTGTIRANQKGTPTEAGGTRPKGAGQSGTSQSSSAITSWVKAHYKSETIGGQTVYNLTRART